MDGVRRVTSYQDWFVVDEYAPGVFGIWEPWHAERVRSSLVVGEESAALIDTGMGVGDIASVVRDLTDKPVRVVNSHAHWDHIGGNWQFTEIAIHEAEAADLQPGVTNNELRSWFVPEHLQRALPAGVSVDRIAIAPSRATSMLRGGEIIDLGGVALEVIHAPGHSPGGIVLLDRARGILFSTDVAYPSTLYCISAGSDLPAYVRTMTSLAALSPTLRMLIPSHDEAPMDPAYLPRMQRGLDAIVQGREPEVVRDGRARHQFPEDGFAVLVQTGA